MDWPQEPKSSISYTDCKLTCCLVIAFFLKCGKLLVAVEEFFLFCIVLPQNQPHGIGNCRIFFVLLYPASNLCSAMFQLMFLSLVLCFIEYAVTHAIIPMHPVMLST
jgi:hypothetical protein